MPSSQSRRSAQIFILSSEPRYLFSLCCCILSIRLNQTLISTFRVCSVSLTASLACSNLIRSLLAWGNNKSKRGPYCGEELPIRWARAIKTRQIDLNPPDSHLRKGSVCCCCCPSTSSIWVSVWFDGSNSRVVLCKGWTKALNGMSIVSTFTYILTGTAVFYILVGTAVFSLFKST